MGLVINIFAHGYWEMTYFVQNINEQKAKEKSFEMFKQTTSCYLPDTLEEAEKDEEFFIEVVTKIDQIIL